MIDHSQNSSFREKLIEHIFIGELLKRSWLDGSCSVEISKPEVDRKGYDIIAERGSVIRHIQLKTSRKGGKAYHQKVHTALAEKVSGCVVWIVFDEETLELGPFWFFGGAAGEALPSIEGMKVAKHTKRNSENERSERPEVREVSRKHFLKIETMEELHKILLHQRRN